MIPHDGDQKSAGGGQQRDGARRSAVQARRLRQVGPCDQTVGRMPMVLKLK
jgi:hypothetical protein